MDKPVELNLVEKLREFIVKETMPPMDSLSYVIKKEYGSVSKFCRKLGYATSNNFYKILNPDEKAYSYRFIKAVAKELDVNKDEFKSLMGITDKFTKEELMEG